MASNNIIFAKPTENTSVDYTLPESESAKLSFSPEEIDGLKLDGSGGLVISFVEGGNVTISNFQEFIDNGNTLSLADGTQVDPKLLFNALGGENDNPFPGVDATRIGIPAEGTTRDITLEPGQKYLLNFDLSETQGADVKDGKMTISFANNSKIVIDNYETAMAGKDAPELALASKTCVVTGDELITNIQKLATIEETIVVVEEETESNGNRKSKIAAADMNGANDIGANDATGLGYQAEAVKPGDAEKAAAIKPAAGDEQDMAEIARELAQVETAAGGPAGGARNSGYGYGSTPGSDPFAGKGDIGPIDPTNLGYKAPFIEPSRVADIPRDSNPLAIGPNAEILDETNLANGPISEEGTISINFGADGPGGINPDGAFTPSGSLKGGVLTSHGESVNVSVSGNDYVGKTGNGTVVFTLTIDSATGNYKFTLFEQLDHADGTNPNDAILLTFGIVAYDGDGDSVRTSVNITILDDAPEITGAEKTVDETNLGPIVEKGQLGVNFGQDGAGTVTTSGAFSASGSVKGNILASGGVAITVAATDGGYVGKAGNVVVFTLDIDPKTGAFTYTQYANLDHANPNDPNDIIKLSFGAKIIDFDGDTDTAPIIINVKDDAPRFEDCGCGGGKDNGNAVEIVDETNLVNGALVETGNITANFGADAPGTYSLKTASFTSTGSKKDGKLTHEGVEVKVTLENGVYVGKAGEKTIFTLSIDATTGAYKYTQYDNFDHADANDPNDVITLKFGVLASDSEGDAAEGSITVHVKDDAPEANNDVNTYDTTTGIANGNVISGVNGGAGAADKLSTDAKNTVTQIKFGDTVVNVPATGTVSIDGQYGKLTIAADGTYSYKLFDTNNGGGAADTAKKFITNDLPDFEYEAIDATEQQALGVAKGNLDVNAGDIITIDFKASNGDYKNVLGAFTVDASGNIKIEKVLVANTKTDAPGERSFTAPAGAETVGLFVIRDGVGRNSSIDFTKGTISVVYHYGQADARPAKSTDTAVDISVLHTAEGGKVTVLGTTLFTSERGDATTLNPDGKVLVVSGTEDGQDEKLTIGFEDRNDNDYNDIIVDIKIGTKGNDCGCGSKDVKDIFTYTLTDGDGDKDTATLTLNGKDLTDDQPIFTAPAVEIVDETNLVSGTITEGGKIIVSFGTDGPGTVGAAGTFTSTGSKLNNALTSGGTAVVVTNNGTTYVGKAGDVTVFTLVIAADGTYTFKLYEQLDHADGNDANDAISLNFGISATDCDGDTSKTTLTVKVLDDAPIANDDSIALNESATATGNVTSNDVPGQDTPATVTKVSFNGTSYDVPTTGQVTVVGTHGTLKISANGVYSYTAKGNTEGSDKFTYTLRDRDGDTDTAILSVKVNDIDTIPSIIKPADEIVDETNLASGVITETGTVIADFKADGPGTFGATGSFTSGGSRTNNALTHNGTPVTVALNGNTYEGKAGGVTVFTLTINTDGSYSFKLYEQLDHADGTDPNDVITLDFGVKATDADGDSATTTITVKVKDDAPVANDDIVDIEDGKTATGNVTNNDKPGQDTPAAVTKISFNGTSYDVPTTGQVTVNGVHGVLKISATGAYTYTANANAGGTDNFTYTLRDRDGDVDTAILSVCVTDKDTTPSIIKPGDEIVDETNLVSGVITETGTITADFKEDGPGTFGGTGSFTSSGSRTNNTLSHNGTPVTVTLTGNTYEGKAGGVTVFTLVINTNGSYTFKLYEQLDHADGNDANDIINLTFGVKATDADGDSAETTLTVKVKDDAPVANDDRNSAEEGATVTGNVTSNDQPGQDTPASVTKVSFNGTSYDVPTTGQLTINGTYGTLKISATGAYTYTAKMNVDGADSFTYTLRDRDGDVDTAILCIDVKDNDTTPSIIKPADEIVDETNLASGTITETGTVTANFFNDGPGTFSANGSFTSSGSRTNNVLSHNGTPVTVALNGSTYEGKAGGVTVFTLTINTNGSYTFKLYEQLDHADGNDANDIINLTFGVKATDADGDSAATTITVKVKDDAPIANDDTLDAKSGETITGNVTTNDKPGQDTPAKVIKIDYNGQSFTVPSTGTVTVQGAHGTLKIAADGSYTYAAKNLNETKTDAFTYTLQDKDGDTDTAVLSICICGCEPNDTPQIIKPADEIVDETNLVSGVITETGTVTANFFNDGPGTFAVNNAFASSGSRTNNALTHNGTAVNVTVSGNTYTGKAGDIVIFTMTVNTNGSYTFKLFKQLDHADGTNPNDIIKLDFGVKATDADGDSAATTITVQVKDDAPDAKDDSVSLNEAGTATGNVTSNDVVGQDAPGAVTKVVYNGTSYDVPTTGQLTINAANGTLKISATGAYTYTAKANADGTDNFTYTLKDKDGDIDTAILCVKVNDTDTIPSIIKPADEIVDETNLVSGVITETGTVTANFFNDGPGTFAANGSFTSGGSRTNNALTHNGTPVTVSLNGNTYEGKAGGVTVFTLAIAADGSYTFKLFEQLDHADGTNPNDIITLDFGVKATDADGDSAATTITVKVKDDAPDAKDDTVNVDEGKTATGNVTSNDVVGQDAPGAVTKVVYNGTSYDVPTTGQLTINAANGTLKISATGAYTYTAKGNTEGTDNFTYTLRDRDGDIDTAVLCVDVKDTDTTPEIIKPAVEIVDETNLASGVITETGTVTANFFGDGPGTFAANGSFTSGGSRTNNALTHNGTPVTVALNGNTYEGKANGVTIFTLVVAANGSYTFKLYEQLDHADGTNPNDIITLDFGVKATDADGDSAATTITVHVKDDAPDAKDDTVNVDEGKTATGNVTNNDVVGQDTPGTVTKVAYNGTSYDVPTTGQLTIDTVNGTLKISATGAYTYVAKSTTSDKQDDFTYTLKDRDGDTDTAKLSICVIDGDDTPQIIKPADETVDETNLSGGVITETGAVTANFFGDGPGTFAATGGFTSAGSRLGNALTSSGVAVTVTATAAGYVGKAGGVTVFTLDIAANGSYTFKLFKALDHADGTNPNDSIALNFGVKATDADGDVATTTLTVNVLDDVPRPTADYCTLFISNKFITSNVLTNDIPGQDARLAVHAITFNGQTVNVPATGTASIVGAYGTLSIAANGTYTYTITHANPPTGSENFTVHTRDYDGDSAPALLQVNLIGDDLTGTSGKDTIYGTSGNDTIRGGGEGDWLYGLGGDDVIYGDDGNDTIDGGAGNDTLYGGNGNDVIYGREGNDTIYGGEGNDNIYGDAGTEATYGGNDRIFGEGGNDWIYAGAGDDYVDGGDGNDTIYGAEGNDILIGGAGDDHLIGGLGNDTLYGGSGSDTFWFMNINEGTDTIKDFTVGTDKLQLAQIITGYDHLTESINDFVFATQSGGNTIISVNPNGNGAGGATQLAILEGVNVTVSQLFNSGSIIH